MVSCFSFCRYYFGRSSFELVGLVPVLYYRGRTCYFDSLHDFSVTSSRFYKGIYVNSFIFFTSRLMNCFPAEYFPRVIISVAFDLELIGIFHLWALAFDILLCFSAFSSPSFNSIPCSSYNSIALYWVNPNLKKFCESYVLSTSTWIRFIIKYFDSSK